MSNWTICGPGKSTIKIVPFFSVTYNTWRDKRLPSSFFGIVRFFRKFFNVSKKLKHFATQWKFKNFEGSPFYIFRHYETVQNSHLSSHFRFSQYIPTNNILFPVFHVITFNIFHVISEVNCVSLLTLYSKYIAFYWGEGGGFWCFLRVQNPISLIFCNRMDVKNPKGSPCSAPFRSNFWVFWVL